MTSTTTIQWASSSYTRVPYAVYQDEGVQAQEQKSIYEGSTWNYLCLEAEVPKPGDYRTGFVGTAPVIVTRAEDGEIYAFENRCSHRGSLISLDRGGAAVGAMSIAVQADRMTMTEFRKTMLTALVRARDTLATRLPTD